MKPKLIETVGNLAVICAEKPSNVEFHIYCNIVEIYYNLESDLNLQTIDKSERLVCSIYETDKINEFIRIVREL